VTEQTCAECRYFADNAPRSMPLECRRFPPTLMKGGGYAWPLVRRDDWCGEWSMVPLTDVPAGGRQRGFGVPAYLFWLSLLIGVAVMGWWDGYRQGKGDAEWEALTREKPLENFRVQCTAGEPVEYGIRVISGRADLSRLTNVCPIESEVEQP
jgi:hypothetical protein